MLTVKGISYETEDISTSSEIYVPMESAEEAAEAYLALRSMGAYTFNGVLYTDKAVGKITLSELKPGSIRIVLKMRALRAEDLADASVLSEARAEAEAARAELEDLKTLVTPLISAKAVSRGGDLTMAIAEERLPVSDLTQLSSVVADDMLLTQTSGSNGDVMLTPISEIISRILDPLFARLDSPALTGEPTAPSITDETAEDDSIATTAFVQLIAARKANTASPEFTGQAHFADHVPTTETGEGETVTLATQADIQGLNESINSLTESLSGLARSFDTLTTTVNLAITRVISTTYMSDTQFGRLHAYKKNGCLHLNFNAEFSGGLDASTESKTIGTISGWRAIGDVFMLVPCQTDSTKILNLAVRANGQIQVYSTKPISSWYRTSVTVPYTS